MTNPAFWDKAAPKYAKAAISDQAAYEYTLGRTRAHLSKTDQVLELGCGTGSTALLLAPDVGHYTATDYAAGMIDIARAKPGDADNITFEVMDQIPETGGYTAVLGFNLFHLIPDMERRFAEIHALLPDGGLFISKTPCIKGGGIKWLLIGMILPLMQALGKAPFVGRFTAATLENAITSAGFDIIESGDHPAPSRYIVARKRAA